LFMSVIVIYNTYKAPVDRVVAKIPEGLALIGMAQNISVQAQGLIDGLNNEMAVAQNLSAQAQITLKRFNRDLDKVEKIINHFDPPIDFNASMFNVTGFNVTGVNTTELQSVFNMSEFIP